MKNDYNLIKRNGRKIQVVFKTIPGKEISTETTNEKEAVEFASKYLQDFDEKRNLNHIPTFMDYAAGFYTKDKYGFKTTNKKKKFFKDEYRQLQESSLENYCSRKW